MREVKLKWFIFSPISTLTRTQLSFFQRDNSSQKVLRLNGFRMLKCHGNNFTNTSNIQTGAHWLPSCRPWSTYTKVVQTHNITSNKAIGLCPFVNSWHIFANMPIFFTLRVLTVSTRNIQLLCNNYYRQEVCHRQLTSCYPRFSYCNG